MLAVAQDEHRFALQLMHDESPEGGAPAAGPGGAPAGPGGAPAESGAAAEGGEDRPRRGPRRGAEAEAGKE
jgi:hypothetical protein